MELPLLLQIPSWSIMSRNEPPGFENCSARSAQLQFAVLTFFCLPLPWVPQGWGKTRMSQQEISASPLTVPWEIGCLTGLEWSHETISWASFGIYSMFSAHTCVATVQLMFHHFGLLFPEGCYLVQVRGVQGSISCRSWDAITIVPQRIWSAGVPGFDLRRPSLCHTSWRTRFAFRRMAQDATIVQKSAEP